MTVGLFENLGDSIRKVLSTLPDVVSALSTLVLHVSHTQSLSHSRGSTEQRKLISWGHLHTASVEMWQQQFPAPFCVPTERRGARDALGERICYGFTRWPCSKTSLHIISSGPMDALGGSVGDSPAVSPCSLGRITPTSVLRAHLSAQLCASSDRSPTMEEHLMPEHFPIIGLHTW